ncbi:hypothetical protein OEG84_25005 [Hoeflea sp. G2-23]|uniref:Methyltransferase type 11 domain-containing protein n=1 Tax=Hoeflea algicola TaxID=2983763 RepID=A0ABT3ZGC9_9HYPH|nr:hypothetical protein [Hoeflea algicola]MCY0150867.1 hypothetical protein [Hoeflea algicola]
MPEAKILSLIREARRVLKSGGIFYALIGLHDHFHNFDKRVSKVNFLRYPEWQWALIGKNRISYHNRLRECDFLNALSQNGAENLVVNNVIDPPDLDRVRSMRVANRFRRYTSSQLAVTRSEIAAKFTNRPA